MRRGGEKGAWVNGTHACQAVKNIGGGPPELGSWEQKPGVGQGSALTHVPWEGCAAQPAQRARPAVR